MRLADKVAIVIGAGQAPGVTDAIGNGRAAALLFAREGAKVLAVDRHLEAAEETAELARADGGEAAAVAADVTDEAAVRAAIEACTARYGRLDILHNNVGISVEGGDAPITEIETEAFDRIVAVNLRSVVYACKHALPIMRAQGGGAIINISSTAALEDYPWVAYKATKAAMIAMTKQVAIQNAEYGVRAKAWGRPRAEVAAERDAKVPLGKMGTGWDVAYAALFLASDEAKFITGVALPVDGGKTCRIG